jgi:hypothetical protein
MGKAVINGLSIDTDTISYLPELGERYQSETVASVKEIADRLYLITTMSGRGTFVTVEKQKPESMI